MSVALKPQPLALTCVAFCSGPLNEFVEWAERQCAGLFRSPLWLPERGAATVGARASRYRAMSEERFLADLAAWRRSQQGSTPGLFAADFCGGPDPVTPVQAVEFVADDAVADASTSVRHLWQATLSLEALRAQSEDALRHVNALIESMAAGPLESGYVAPVLPWPRDPRSPRPPATVGGWGLRVPSLDVQSNGATRFEIAGQCRGARWCVMLDEDLAAQCDPALVAHLPDKGVLVGRSGRVHRFQVDASPFERWTRGGAVERRYRAMAAALDPITFFDDLDLQRLRFGNNADLLDRYERRFLHASI